MTDSARPLCDCDEPCGCFAEGYAAGKDKAYFEVLASLEGPRPRRGLRLPTLPGEAGLPAKGDDADRQKLARDLRAGGGLGPGGGISSALKLRAVLEKRQRSFRCFLRERSPRGSTPWPWTTPGPRPAADPPTAGAPTSPDGGTSPADAWIIGALACRQLRATSAVTCITWWRPTAG